MDNKILVCNLCGYTTDTFICKAGEHESCPICQTGELEIKEAKTKNFEAVEKEINNKMAEQVRILGDNRAWSIIESFKKAETRLAYRKLFLKAGGVIPENVFWVKEISGKEYLKILI